MAQKAGTDKGSNQNFASVIMTAAGERKQQAISQLARNSNMHFGNMVSNSEQISGT